MAKISGVGRVIAALKRLWNRYNWNKDGVTVGFAQPYALAVHEMVLWKHKVGQAKYLQQAAQSIQGNRSGVAQLLKGGAKISTVLMVTGLKIQREAQRLVPVDTGALKASAYTCKIGDEVTVAEAAHRKGEAQRAKSLSKRP